MIQQNYILVFFSFSQKYFIYKILVIICAA